MEGIEAVAFDLDGTLIDSAPDIQHALNAALRTEGLRGFDLGTVRAWIGDGPDILIARALERLQAQDARLQFDPGLPQRLRRWYDVDALSAPLGLGQGYADIHVLVQALHERLPLVIVTNKPTPLARAVLEAAGLLPFMSAVFGADTAALRKPSPALLLNAAQRLGCTPAQLLMVGDSALDLASAAAAGCPAVCVGWGYGSAGVHAEPRLSPGQAAWRIDTPLDLLDLLAACSPAHDASG